MRKLIIAAGAVIVLPLAGVNPAEAASLSSYICAQVADVPSAPPVAISYNTAAPNMGVIARWRYALDAAEARLLISRMGHDSWRSELSKRAGLAHSASAAAQKWWDASNIALEDSAVSSSEASKIRNAAAPAIDKYRQLTRGC